MKTYIAQFINDMDELKRFRISAENVEELISKVKSKFPTANPIQVQLIRRNK